MQEKDRRPTISRDKNFDISRLAPLVATGEVPDGYSFLTNISHINPDFPNRNTLKLRNRVVAEYRKKGFYVAILPGLAFDIHGRPTGGDAIIIKKKPSSKT